MLYEIVEMTPNYIDAVVELWRCTPGICLNDHDDSREGIDRFLLRNPGLSFVATEKSSNSDNIIGAVLCGHDGRRGYLHHLAVATSHRKHGVGAALVERCLEGLRSQGIAKCNIFVLGCNVEGQKFWQRVGWNELAGLIVMQRALSMDGAPVR